MTSIRTNASAMEALSTLRLLSAQSTREQSAVSTGLRISEASDGASYWSIATGMRSDLKSLSAVQDALGLGAAKADVAYAALDQVSGLLTEIQSRLVAATEPGVDQQAIQKEIAQLALQTREAASAASFAGTNWLTTDIEDLWDAPIENRSTSLVSSFSRDAAGNVSIGTMNVDLRETALFNAEGGGILEADPRSPGTIGGIRSFDAFDGTPLSRNGNSGSNAYLGFSFSGPLDFSSGGTLSFDVTVDADNPSAVPGPHNAGSTASVTIDRSMVEAALGGSATISDYREMVQVLSSALTGTGARAGLVSDYRGEIIPDRFFIGTAQNSGLDGSHVKIESINTSVGGSGGISAGESYGSRGHSMTLSFVPFKVYDGVEISFDFGFNGVQQPYVIDRAFVDGVLGSSDGRVDTAADMTAVLQALVGQPGLIIEEQAGNTINLRTDASDRLSGSKSNIGFGGISVNIEPIPAFGVFDIDIATNPHLVGAYRDAVGSMMERVNTGAAAVGALKARLDLQSDFTSSLRNTIERGIGTLVDADMEAASTRMRALDVQRQLATQALSIANAQSQSILALFS